MEKIKEFLNTQTNEFLKYFQSFEISDGKEIKEYQDLRAFEREIQHTNIYLNSM